MVITFDFGNGVIREYTADETINNILKDEGFIDLQIKHPKFAEHCVVKGTTNKDGLYLNLPEDFEGTNVSY